MTEVKEQKLTDQYTTFLEAIEALDAGFDMYIHAPMDSLCHSIHGSAEETSNNDRPVQELMLYMAFQQGWPVHRLEDRT